MSSAEAQSAKAVTRCMPHTCQVEGTVKFLAVTTLARDHAHRKSSQGVTELISVMRTSVGPFAIYNGGWAK